jgi:hypothetical protein
VPRSELDEALFSGTEPDSTPTQPTRPQEAEAELSALDAELFGDDADPGVRRGGAAIPPEPRRNGRAKRFGVGLLVVILVLGLGGLAYAAFGGSDDDRPPRAPKVEVRGTEVTRTTLRSTTTSSTSTSTTTTSSTTTTTAPPSPSAAPVVEAEPAPEPEPPATEPPPAAEPPPTAPPPTEPPPTTPTTSPPTTAPPTEPPVETQSG